MAQGAGEHAKSQLELWPRPHRSEDFTLRLIGADGREAELNAEALAASIAQTGSAGDGLDWDTSLSLSRAVVAFLRHSSEPEPFAHAVIVQTVERVLVGMGFTRSAHLYARSNGGTRIATDAAVECRRWDALLQRAEIESHARYWIRRASVAPETGDEICDAVVGRFEHYETPLATHALVREMVFAELLARGLTHAAERIAHVSVAIDAIESQFRGDDRGASDLPDTRATIGYLASTAYAYSRVFTDRVATSVARGELRTDAFADMTRLDRITLDPEDLKSHEASDGDGGNAASGSGAEELARRLARYSAGLSRHFLGPVHWRAVNFSFAPLLSGADDAQLRHAAYALFLESAHDEGKRSEPPIEINLRWDPAESTPRVLRGGGAPVSLEDAYAPARRFFTAALDALLHVSERETGARLPTCSLTLSPYFFGAPEASANLDRIAGILANGFPLTLCYAPADAMLMDDAEPAPRVEIVAQTVTVSLRRAAEQADGLRDFLARAERATDDAVGAHLSRHAQLAELARCRSGALAPLRRPLGGSTLLDVNALRYLVGVDGIEAVLDATVWLSREDAPAALEEALSRMRGACARWSASTGRPIHLSGPEFRDAAPASNRQAVSACAGLHAHAADPAPCLVRRDSALSTRDAISDFIRWAFLYTPCRALRIC